MVACWSSLGTDPRNASTESGESHFNSSLGGNTRREIDRFEGDTIAEDAFRALVKDAVALNES